MVGWTNERNMGERKKEGEAVRYENDISIKF